MRDCFKLTGRKDWGALPPKDDDPLIKPAKYVFYVNTFTELCRNNHSCSKTIQLLQREHMKKKGYNDICYNFLISSNGRVYEGRGGLTQPQLPKKYARMSHKSIFIAFIGMFKDEYEIPNCMLRAGNLLIDYAIQQEYIRYNYQPVQLFKLRDMV